MCIRDRVSTQSTWDKEMLANMIQEILSKVLEKYVEKIKDEDMEMNLMGGNIKFQNLLLKKTLLSDLEVPFEMRYGKIQSLQAKLMIAKIGAEPVEVTINGLYFLLRLKEGLLNNSRRNWDLQEKKLWIIKYIQRNTQNIADRVKRDLAGGNQGGMFSKIGMKILDNLQIYISNIHLQIESVDQDSHPFAFGIGINELRVFTTNENWERCFLDRTLPANSSAPLNKCINANIFLYFLTSSEGYISEKSPDFSSPPTIPKEGHILAPIDITIHLTHRQKKKKKKKKKNPLYNKKHNQQKKNN
eukprot:TRINITY_DN58455_c0_g1_i1.p1 TRINITY_DN58455_c0_g1~~TRINITY_DN58455_c0_g1_i1.p1  ORF type:complete len:301 (+),score=61.68 TRINITY_DN58455_c0_g1_i1:147-1049(+)